MFNHSFLRISKLDIYRILVFIDTALLGISGGGEYHKIQAEMGALSPSKLEILKLLRVI